VGEAVEQHGPLLIAEVEYADPVFTLNGDGWGLTLVCPWRLVRGTDLVLSWSAPEAPDAVWDLIGRRITAVAPRGRDVAFPLSDGTTLEVFCDTDVDPWVLRLPGATYVGPDAG
jgi:hypothetical protein